MSTFFHESLFPTIEIGQLWLLIGITSFNPYDIPLLITIIPISSELTITWSHHAIIKINFKLSKIINSFRCIYLCYSIYKIYKGFSFATTDSVNGSTFSVVTGFHGVESIKRSRINWNNILNCNALTSTTNSFFFKSSFWIWNWIVAWYWHFLMYDYFFTYQFIDEVISNFIILI